MEKQPTLFQVDDARVNRATETICLGEKRKTNSLVAQKCWEIKIH